MKELLTTALLCTLLCTLSFSQIGKVGINTSSPAAMLHVKDSSVVFSSPYYENFPQYDAPPPVSGAGARMMWYPQRRSLRSGMVTGTQWNQSNTGFYSFASGYNPIANGEIATAIGKEVIANGFSGLVIGHCNDPIVNTPQDFLEPTTPLFILGNGDDPGNRSNALVALKNGRIGIGTNVPAARLHVEEESVLFRGPGTLPGTPGSPPVSGAGTRMMWYADKAAFRVGLVEGTQWDKDSIGLYSFATGFNTRAKGQYALALGSNNRASGSGSVALGIGNVSTGTSSVALGTNGIASGNYATTIGAGADAIGSHSLAGGYTSKAEGSYSIAIGYDVLATGIQSVALGANTTASGFLSFATGGTTKAKGSFSSSFGFSTTAKGTNTAAFGRQTLANGYASTVIGMFNDSILAVQTSPTFATPLFIIGNGDHDTTRSNAMVVRKDGRMGLGADSPLAQLHVEENSVLFRGPTILPDPAGDPPVSGAGTRLMWYADKAAFRAGAVTSIQWNKDSIGLHSIAAGFNAMAKGPGSVSLGSNTKATGVNSVAMGSLSKASGDYATAMGSSTFATGHYSIAIGDGNLASASASTALGKNTTASNAYAVAFGHQTSATGQGAVASGYSTQAISAYSIAMGSNTIARANNAVASGDNTTAAGAASFAMGVDTKAKSYACMALGRFNDTTSVSAGSWDVNDPLFIIGIGSGNNNRKNALTVVKSGKMGIGTIAPVNILQIRALNDTLNGPILSLGGTSADQAESGRIRFYEGTASTNLRGGYIHLDGAANRFHIGIHPTSDNIVSNDVDAISIDRGSGEVGIGTANPNYLLEVNGTAGKPGGGSWTNSSDARLKQDVHPYADGLHSILAIRPVRFHYNTDSGYDTAKEYVGVIAQELKEVAPYMVHTSGRILPDGSTGYLDVDNSAMTYMLINAVKEQNTIITVQQERIDDLEKQIQEIRALLEGVTQK